MLIYRRAVVALLSCSCAPKAFAKPLLFPTRGAVVSSCSVPDAYVNEMFDKGARASTAIEQASAIAKMKELLRKSGDPQIDIELDRALYRIATTFEVMPSFGFDTDEGMSTNAWASDVRSIPETDGTVGFGFPFFRDWMAYDPSGIAALAIAAHEFGHIWMKKTGNEKRVLAAQRTVKRNEA